MLFRFESEFCLSRLRNPSGIVQVAASHPGQSYIATDEDNLCVDPFLFEKPRLCAKGKCNKLPTDIRDRQPDFVRSGAGVTKTA